MDASWKKITIGTSIAGALILGVIIGNLFGSSEKSDCKKVHFFINAELDCIDTDTIYSHFKDAENKVNNLINKKISEKKATRVSVFFRDLNTRRWFGVNYHDTFSPGSLLKLPLAMAYYKYSEIDPDIFSQQVTFNLPKGSNSLNALEHFPAPTYLVSGKSYTVEELLERMLKYSDNDATLALFDFVNKELYEKVLQDFNIHIPSAQQGGIRSDFSTPQAYASILRSLFNASYLGIEQSEQVLESLSQSTFDKGLRVGIPEKTTVSNKFGEGTAVDPRTNTAVKVELHDCGIIYQPNSPYILCVMAEGSDFNELARVISDISNIVWNTGK